MTKFLLFFLLIAFKSHALEIVVDKGQESAQPVIVVPFSDNSALAEISLAEVIASDLALSGKFRPLADNLLPSFPAAIDDVDFSNFKGLGASFMIVGRVFKDSGSLKLTAELLDVHKEQRIAKYSHSLANITARHLRKAGHKISDLIYEKLTGKRGAFSTRLAYVSVRVSGGQKTYALEVSGVDGKDAAVAFKSPKSIFSPAWSPDGKKLSYVSLENDKTQVWVLDLVSGQRQKYADFPGNNSAPAWAPDGSALALSLSKDGNPEIYIIAQGGALRRVTNNPAADTEPVWAPNASSLYFLSDRGGSPQIYQLLLADGSVNKVSTFGSYNASPDISVDGNNLALLHKTDQGYQIAVQNLANQTLNIVSNTFNDESPSFAPNGEMLVYATKDSGNGVLTVTDAKGTVHRVYSSAHKDVREPAWSPFLD